MLLTEYSREKALEKSNSHRDEKIRYRLVNVSDEKKHAFSKLSKKRKHLKSQTSHRNE